MGYCEDKFLSQLTQTDELQLDQLLDERYSAAFQYSYNELRQKQTQGGGGLDSEILTFLLSFSEAEYESMRQQYNSQASGYLRKMFVFNLRRTHSNPIALDAYTQCLQLPRVDYTIDNGDQDIFQLTLKYERGSLGSDRTRIFGNPIFTGGVAPVGRSRWQNGAELIAGQSYTESFRRSMYQDGFIRINFANDRPPSLVLAVLHNPPPHIVTEAVVTVPGHALARYVPPHTCGDADWWDKVHARCGVSLALAPDQRQLLATIGMDANEFDGDTAASGVWANIPYYQSPNTILSFALPGPMHAEYEIRLGRGQVTLNEHTISEMRNTTLPPILGGGTPSLPTGWVLELMILGGS